MYRVRYWRHVNTQYGEWAAIDVPDKEAAERLAEHLRPYHEQVEIKEADDAKR